MGGVVRSGGTDSVFSPDGTGYKCRAPMTTSTGPATQTRVTAMGIPIVVAGDQVAMHPLSGCGPDTSTLSSYSSKVSACGSGIARIGDMYGNNIIISCAPRVFGN